MADDLLHPRVYPPACARGRGADGQLGQLICYVVKGEGLKVKDKELKGYPTLACHLDQVQELHSDDFCVKEEDGTLYGWSEKNQRREGLGADDKNGIWVCLRCLVTNIVTFLQKIIVPLNDVKWLFFSVRNDYICN